MKTWFQWRNQFSWLRYCWRGNWYKTFDPQILFDWVCLNLLFWAAATSPVSCLSDLYINICRREDLRSISSGKGRISQDVWRLKNALPNIASTLSHFFSCHKFAKFRGHPEFRQLVHTTFEHCQIVQKCAILRNYHLWAKYFERISARGGVFIMHISSAFWFHTNLIFLLIVPPPHILGIQPFYASERWR